MAPDSSSATEISTTTVIVETDKGILITPYDPDFELGIAAYKKAAAKYRNALRELSK